MKPQKIPKLTRKQIAEGLQRVPVGTVLLGASNARQTRLTHKQMKFAEAVAMGKTKAAAYRECYSSKGKPITQGHEGHRLAATPKIAAQIEALRLANEARAYATPAALRSLVIERLTAHAIDDDIAPAQRLRALELLGKITEVAAFTERRELVRTTDAGSARDALVASLRAALRASAVDAEIVEPLADDSGALGIVEDAGSDEGPAADAPGATGGGRIDMASDPGADGQGEEDAGADRASGEDQTGPGDDPAGADPTRPHPPEPRASTASDYA